VPARWLPARTPSCLEQWFEHSLCSNYSSRLQRPELRLPRRQLVPSDAWVEDLVDASTRHMSFLPHRGLSRKGQGGGRALVALVDVDVLAVNEPREDLKICWPGSAAWLPADISRAKRAIFI
jgi:hypothetical protein